MATRKPASNKSSPKRPSQPPSTSEAKPETPITSSNLRILKKATCPTLSGKSTLTYAIACNSQKQIFLRVQANDGGGFFSQEWIRLSSIQEVLADHDADSPITSIVFWPLFRGKSVNTPAFLLAVLVAEKLLKPKPKKQRVHEVCDPSDFNARISKLVASSVDLPDDAAKTAPKLPTRKAPPKADLSRRKPGRRKKPTT